MESTGEQKASAERPRAVTRAVQLLAASVAIGMLRSIFSLTQRTSGVPMILALLIVVAFFALLLFVVLKISAGRNWARIMVLIVVVVLVLFVPFAVPAYLAELRRNALFGILGISITLLQVLGTCLLFTRTSNLWFRTSK